MSVSVSVVALFLLAGGKRQPRHLGEFRGFFGGFLGWRHEGRVLWMLGERSSLELNFSFPLQVPLPHQLPPKPPWSPALCFKAHLKGSGWGRAQPALCLPWLVGRLSLSLVLSRAWR